VWALAPKRTRSEVIHWEDFRSSQLADKCLAMVAFTHDEYTIGWIFPLGVTLTVATTMLDGEHEPLPRSRSDDNIYTLERIGKHNVVLACLPLGKLGVHSVAAVAFHTF
jgi:hypothetical protein